MPDLFISYAHVDKHWVDTFVPLLEQRVNQYAGRLKLDRIWKDNRLGGNTLLNPEIDTQLAQAQCLVSILSPGYLASEWCKYELAQFSARVGIHSDRLFCIELDQLAMGDKPEILTHALGYRFWWQDPLSKRTYPLNANEPDFETRLIDVAKDITQMLTRTQVASPVGASPAGDSLVRQVHPTSIGHSLSFHQQKLTALQSRQALLLELLTRQREELTFADDPKRQMRLERDIRTTQVSLEQLETELVSYQSG